MTAAAEILDACCGGRHWWWDKAHPLASRRTDTLDYLLQADERMTATLLAPLVTGDEDQAWVALMLSPTPEIWAALLKGDPVNEAELDQLWLRRFRILGLM